MIEPNSLSEMKWSPPWRPAGRCAIDYLALLEPLDLSDTIAVTPGVRLWRRGAHDPQSASRLPAQESAKREALDDHFLVLFPSGRFLATDRIAFASVSHSDSNWRFEFRLERSEGFDGTPAPARLCLVLALRIDSAAAKTLRFEFTAPPGVAVMPLRLELSA